MRPPLAIARRVRIAFLVRELVMLTMRGHPQERAPLQRRRAANRKKVLKPLRGRVGAMGEQSVITYAKSQAPRHPVKEERDEQCIPREEEGCRECPNVKQRQNRRDQPVDLILAGLVVLNTLEAQAGWRGHSFPMDFDPSLGRNMF